MNSETLYKNPHTMNS